MTASAPSKIALGEVVRCACAVGNDGQYAPVSSRMWVDAGRGDVGDGGALGTPMPSTDAT